MFRLLLLAAALIVYGSTYPWRFDFAHGPANPLAYLLRQWTWSLDRWVLRDVVINVLLYAPLGAAACLSVVRRHSRWAALGFAVAFAAALSASMEMLQAYIPGRNTSMLDVVSNMAGAAAGAIAALALRTRIERLTAPHAGPKGDTAAGFLLATWAAYQLFPLFPSLNRTKLSAELWRLAHPLVVSPVEIWASAAEWYAAGLAAEAFAGRRGPAWLWAAMLCLPVRLVVADRHVAVEEVLGAALGLLLLRAAPRPSRAGALWLLGSAVAARGLMPFHFRSRPMPFSWIPFAGSLGNATWIAAAVVLLRKFYNYGALAWLLRGSGMSWHVAGLLLAAALMALETAQRWLPGHSPEITDAMLALVAAFVLARLSDPRHWRGLA
jgi:VanZ family protein